MQITLDDVRALNWRYWDWQNAVQADVNAWEAANPEPVPPPEPHYLPAAVEEPTDG